MNSVYTAFYLVVIAPIALLGFIYEGVTFHFAFGRMFYAKKRTATYQQALSSTKVKTDEGVA